MVINHRHTRRGFANARHDSEWRKRKRRASVLVCGSKHRAKADGAQGFYRRAAHPPKKLCFGGQIRRSRTRRVRKHPRGRPLPCRGVRDAPIAAE